MVKKKYLVGMVLLLFLSLTACKPPVSKEEKVSSPEVEDLEIWEQKDSGANVTKEGDRAAVSHELFMAHTDIQTRIAEYDAQYLQYAELKKYLDEKQFALLRIAYKNNTELFEGKEALDYVEDWDWNLVRPLQNISAGDCGYGKIDYNNDGKEAIIYRSIDVNRQIAATVYEPDDTAEQIVSEYDLVEIFPDIVQVDGMLEQLWFEKIGENVVTFRLLRKNCDEEFILYSDIVTVQDTKIQCSRLETRYLTVITEHAVVTKQNGLCGR